MVQPQTAAAADPPRKISFEDFLVQYQGIAAEWVDGEVELVTVTRDHQEIVGFLLEIMRPFVRRRKLGAVHYDPFVMHTGPDLPGRAPDLMFIANDHLDRLHDLHLEGPADLAIEVTSADSQYRDRRRKFSEYERGGVPEYWIIDPQKRRVDFFVRNAEGRFEARHPDAHGVYRPINIRGFWIRVEWLWEIPDRDVLADIEAGDPV